MIKLIVGLGNPGQQYQNTRHNAGFWFVDELVSASNALWQNNKKYNAHIALVKIDRHDVVLLKPLTFMNKSGFSVAAYMRYHQLQIDEILVIHDELDFVPGVVKLKKNGGHAGHNGLRDIIAQVGANNFLRLRIGIGRPDGNVPVADYVLNVPSRDDQIKIELSYKKILAKLALLFEKELDLAINEFHVAD